MACAFTLQDRRTGGMGESSCREFQPPCNVITWSFGDRGLGGLDRFLARGHCALELGGGYRCRHEGSWVMVAHFGAVMTLLDELLQADDRCREHMWCRIFKRAVGDVGVQDPHVTLTLSAKKEHEDWSSGLLICDAAATLHVRLAKTGPVIFGRCFREPIAVLESSCFSLRPPRRASCTFTGPLFFQTTKSTFAAPGVGRNSEQHTASTQSGQGRTRTRSELFNPVHWCVVLTE